MPAKKRRPMAAKQHEYVVAKGLPTTTEDAVKRQNRLAKLAAQPSRQRRYADDVMATLHLTDRDYN